MILFGARYQKIKALRDVEIELRKISTFVRYTLLLLHTQE
jgi:hypothetical protein